MLDLSFFDGIYFYEGIVDFRKSIDGLSVIAQDVMGKPIFKKLLFVFVSRDKRKIKLLFWDQTGFMLIYKRLEKERFRVVRKRQDKTVLLNREQLTWLLSGMEWWKMKRHAPVKLENVS